MDVLDRIRSEPCCWPAWVAIFALIVVLAVWKYVHVPEPPLPEVDLEAACPEDRWLGLLKTVEDNRPMTAPDGWQPVFSSYDPIIDKERIDEALDVPPGLQRYYFYQGPDPRPEHLEFFDRIDKDCEVVGPAARTFFPPRDLRNALRARFKNEAGQAPTHFDAERVRLVIIDSVQDTATRPEHEACPDRPAPGDLECSRHGQVLARLAKVLLGNGADVESRRALRRTYKIQSTSSPESHTLGIVNASGEKQGGLYGSWSELADAIWRAVGAWSAEGSDRNLILNLSVGWDRMYGSDVPVVHDAIATAVCRGALIVAAAGNRVAGPTDLERPLLPAAWEEKLAPDREECKQLLGVEPDPKFFLARSPDPNAAPPACNLQPASRPPYRPLVYAVGGVDHKKRLMSNARPGATPRLVAFGDHVPVGLPVGTDNPERLATLTGTSVSTLVASAAAAVQWSRCRELNAFEVMETVWDAGVMTGHRVDFCLDPGINCSSTSKAKRVIVGPPATSSPGPAPAATALPLSSSTPRGERIHLPRLRVVQDCDPQVLAYRGTLHGDATLCPQRKYFDVRAQPWLGPQPGTSHNQDCRLIENSPGKLVLEFDPCFRVKGMKARLGDLTLIAGDKAYRLPVDEFWLGDPGRANDPNSLCPQDDDNRRKQFVFSDFPVDDPHPIYLAVTVTTANGETYSNITPILHERTPNP